MSVETATLTSVLSTQKGRDGRRRSQPALRLTLTEPHVVPTTDQAVDLLAAMIVDWVQSSKRANVTDLLLPRPQHSALLNNELTSPSSGRQHLRCSA